MFDIATRPQPSSDAAAVFGVPFDLRLVLPLAPSAYPYTDYNNATGAPQAGVEVLATYAVELEDTLQTAVILSLFTDRRAGRDDKLPLHQTDRRGWVGDEFMADEGDAWGSALWLVYSGKSTADVLERARFAAQEALAWLVRDGIASRVDVTAEWVGARGDRLAVRPSIYKPDQVRPVYDVLWGTTITRGAAA
jgi:phage gp46-like protein